MRSGRLCNAIASNSGSNNNISTFGVFWDDSYLYVAVKVLDSDLRKDSPGPWDDDSVEIYVDGAGERSATYDANDRQFIKRWSDTALTAPQDGMGVLHGTADITGGYTVELAIPWSNLGVSAHANMTLGFDVQQNDDDAGGARGGAMSWNATHDTNFKSTADFGATLSWAAGGPGGGGDRVAGGTGGGGAGGAAGGGDQAPRSPGRTCLSERRHKTAGLAGARVSDDLRHKLCA